tara:strand:- start:1343 stop:1753 length:411 start_codon:yes stop_codon:yes gene_type:complete
MSARPSRRHASKTDQAKQRLEQLKRLKEDGKKRLDDIDGDEDVANVYDEVRSPFPSSSSSSSLSKIGVDTFFQRRLKNSKNVCTLPPPLFLCHRLRPSPVVFFDSFKTTTLTTKKNKNKNDAAKILTPTFIIEPTR